MYDMFKDVFLCECFCSPFLLSSQEMKKRFYFAWYLQSTDWHWLPECKSETNSEIKPCSEVKNVRVDYQEHRGHGEKCLCAHSVPRTNPSSSHGF